MEEDIIRIKHINEEMGNNIEEIVEHWNLHGQIIEDQFLFASSYNLKHLSTEIMRNIISHEDYIAENDMLEDEDYDVWGEDLQTKLLETAFMTEAIPICKGGSYINTVYSKRRVSRDQMEQNVKEFEAGIGDTCNPSRKIMRNNKDKTILEDKESTKQYFESNEFERCSQCGKILRWGAEDFTIFGEPLCDDCMTQDEYGEICLHCGRKAHREYMYDGFCKFCYEKIDI